MLGLKLNHVSKLKMLPQSERCGIDYRLGHCNFLSALWVKMFSRIRLWKKINTKYVYHQSQGAVWNSTLVLKLIPVHFRWVVSCPVLPWPHHWSCVSGNAVYWRFGSRDPGFESCIQQRKTAGLLSIRYHFLVASRSQLTAPNMYAYVYVYVYMYVCIYIYIYIYVCVCVCVCVKAEFHGWVYWRHVHFIHARIKINRAYVAGCRGLWGYMEAHIDGLVQDYRNSSALAMELLQSYTKPSTCTLSWKVLRNSPTRTSRCLPPPTPLASNGTIHMAFPSRIHNSLVWTSVMPQ